MTLKQVIEALIFASPKPLTVKEMLDVLKAAGRDQENSDAQGFATAKAADIEEALAQCQAELAQTERSFQLVERVNGWSLVSDPACAAWVRQLFPEAKPTRLSGPQLETLAIVAYRQPVTRADIEAVRGVAVDGVMQVLLDRSLVKIAGRAEVPGRPLLYATTEYFLEHFGLKNTDELPNASELKRVALPAAKTEETAAPKETEPASKAEPELPGVAGEKPADEAAPAAAEEEGAAPAEAETEAPASEPEPAAPDQPEASEQQP